MKSNQAQNSIGRSINFVFCEWNDYNQQMNKFQKNLVKWFTKFIKKLNIVNLKYLYSRSYIITQVRVSKMKNFRDDINHMANISKS